MKRVLFVCTGNICRSPSAEGVAKKILKTSELRDIVEVDSAGTHGYHAGESPDPRSQRAAARRGIDLSGLRARQVEAGDFLRFDLLLAMDRDNLAHLHRLCPAEHRHKLGLFLEYAHHVDLDEVPDPYYGSADGFERVLDLAEDAVRGLMQVLREG